MTSSYELPPPEVKASRDHYALALERCALRAEPAPIDRAKLQERRHAHG